MTIPDHTIIYSQRQDHSPGWLNLYSYVQNTWISNSIGWLRSTGAAPIVRLHLISLLDYLAISNHFENIQTLAHADLLRHSLEQWLAKYPPPPRRETSEYPDSLWEMQDQVILNSVICVLTSLPEDWCTLKFTKPHSRAQCNLTLTGWVVAALPRDCWVYVHTCLYQVLVPLFTCFNELLYLPMKYKGKMKRIVIFMKTKLNFLERLGEDKSLKKVFWREKIVKI